MKNQNTPATEYNDKFRHFAIMTYIRQEELEEYVKNESIVKYAYIRHDKEESEPHWHLVVSFKNPRTKAGVLKDFKDYDQNTFVEVVRSVTGVLDYLTHKNHEDKFQYDQKDVVNCGYYRGDFRRSNQAVEREQYKNDNAVNIVDSILDGLTKRELLYTFGREYVIHRRAYEDLAYAIRAEESEDYVYYENQPTKAKSIDKCRILVVDGDEVVNWDDLGKNENKREVIQNEIICD